MAVASGPGTCCSWRVPARSTARNSRPPKRERTRRQLIDAAVRLFARQDAGATSLVDLAAEADVAHGTVYNYFRNREEMIEAVAAGLADELSEHVTALSAGIDDPARRLAVGVRTFVQRALASPDWGRVLLRLNTFAPHLRAPLALNVLRDLRAGRRGGCFRFGSEAGALDLVIGSTLAAMRSAVEGRARPGHDRDIAQLVLRGLGVDARTAERLASSPMPGAAADAGR
jgi:AcrR family transcriptional regulator